MKQFTKMAKTNIDLYGQGMITREIPDHLNVMKDVSSFFHKISVENPNKIMLKGSAATSILFPDYQVNDFDIDLNEESMEKVINFALSPVPTFFISFTKCLRLTVPERDKIYHDVVVKGTIVDGLKQYPIEFVNFPLNIYDFAFNSFIATFIFKEDGEEGEDVYVGISAKKQAIIELYRYVHKLPCFGSILSKKKPRRKDEYSNLLPLCGAVKRIEKALEKGTIISGIEKMKKFEVCSICWNTSSRISQYKFCKGKDCCVKCAIRRAHFEPLRFKIHCITAYKSPDFSIIKKFFEIN